MESNNFRYIDPSVQRDVDFYTQSYDQLYNDDSNDANTNDVNTSDANTNDSNGNCYYYASSLAAHQAPSVVEDQRFFWTSDYERTCGMGFVRIPSGYQNGLGHEHG
jgi:hypothetical protein